MFSLIAYTRRSGVGSSCHLRPQFSWWIHPGVSHEPSGFILTTILGIVGAFVATFLGQAVGWYRGGEGAGLIGAIGAVIVLVVWGTLANRTRGA